MNRTTLLTLLLTGWAGLILAQQQPENAGFETWEDVGLNTDEPFEWSSIKTSDNSFLNGLAPYVWDQSTDAHSGNYSVKLFNTPILTTVAAGIVTNGQIHADFNPENGYAFTNTADDRWNTAFTLKPDSLVLWAKYSPLGGDVAQAKAVLHTGTAQIPDPDQTNWLAIAQIDITSQTSTWTRFSAPFTYFNQGDPQYILFVLNAGGTSATANSTAWFDDVELIYNDALIDLTLFLQGPYLSNKVMSADLNPNMIPLAQPFNTAPWNYNGTESVVSLPSPDIVDWLLIEVRDANSAANATPATTVAKQAAFLLNDGSVVGLDGISRLAFPIYINENLFVVVHHRNHLPVMSANPLSKTNGEYVYDFSTGAAKNYGGTNAVVQLNLFGTQVWGMVAGDANADGVINTNDGVQLWYPQAGYSGYLQSDVNLDGQANNPDKNDYWFENLGKESQVPE
ncbi:MAG: hypothetical protein KDC05_10030 [Bacteroidales bacterium]|nr:hypothetical protein [Bacteroidales bacterium]